MMKKALTLGVGFIVAAGLLVATVWLWVHSLIIFAAPVGFLAAGVAWVAVDNTFIYPNQRLRAAGAATPEPPADASDGAPFSVPR